MFCFDVVRTFKTILIDSFKIRKSSRYCKSLNNIVERDHRIIKRRIMRGLGFEEFESMKRTISGIELLE